MNNFCIKRAVVVVCLVTAFLCVQTPARAATTVVSTTVVHQDPDLIDLLYDVDPELAVRFIVGAAVGGFLGIVSWFLSKKEREERGYCCRSRW